MSKQTSRLCIIFIFMVDLFEGETVILSNPVKSITLLQYRAESGGSDGGYVEVKLNIASIVLTNFRVILLTRGGEGVTERFKVGVFKFVKGPSKFQYIFYNTPAFFDIAKKLATKNKELWKQNLEKKAPIFDYYEIRLPDDGGFKWI